MKNNNIAGNKLKKWEKVVDFTKIKKEGIDIKDVLSRMMQQEQKRR